MKYCELCGTELNDNAVYCSSCGNKINSGVYQRKSSSVSIIKTIAFIFMLINTVNLGFAIFPLAWCIPMCVSYYKKMNNNEQIGTGFKICTLLFVSLIAGILMLVDEQ